ncbi:MAG: hypothetical protein R2838_04165 [Caldilineaceae bacterium]
MWGRRPAQAREQQVNGAPVSPACLRGARSVGGQEIDCADDTGDTLPCRS